MADEIKQTRTISQIQPLKPSRDASRRKQPRRPKTKARASGKPQPDAGGRPHSVDEYV